MQKYVTRRTMEAEAPGVYAALPAQFRDTLPAGVSASSQNAQIFRATFNVVPKVVDDLFARLGYAEGSDWPMWKLVAAFYLVQSSVGPNTVRAAGERIYSTMPWPPQVRSLADALRFTETAYFESHLRAPRELAGGWRVVTEAANRMVLADETPYPCFVNEGVIAGICRAFSAQRPSYRVLELPQPKRDGGAVTRYDVTFRAPAGLTSP